MSNLVLVASAGLASPSLSGTWRSWQTPQAAATPFSIEFTANEIDGEVHGHGQFAVGAIRGVPFALSGKHDHPMIRVTIRASGVQDASFDGTFVGTDEVRGLLSGSGFGRLTLFLKRDCRS